MLAGTHGCVVTCMWWPMLGVILHLLRYASSDPGVCNEAWLFLPMLVVVHSCGDVCIWWPMLRVIACAEVCMWRSIHVVRHVVVTHTYCMCGEACLHWFMLVVIHSYSDVLYASVNLYHRWLPMLRHACSDQCCLGFMWCFFGYWCLWLSMHMLINGWLWHLLCNMSDQYTHRCFQVDKLLANCELACNVSDQSCSVW